MSLTARTAYTLPAAALEFGIGRDAILAAIKGGYLSGHLNGTKWVIKHVDIDAWIESLPTQPKRRAPRAA